MPVPKRATDSPQSQCARLLGLFPCPAWIEDASERILARNEHPCPAQSGTGTRAGTILRAVLSAGNSPQPYRLVALFPSGRETEILRRVTSALLANAFQASQPPQAPAVDEVLLARLSPQQQKICRAYTPGCNCKETAASLDISHNVFLVQLSRIRQKLGLKIVPLQRQRRK